MDLLEIYESKNIGIMQYKCIAYDNSSCIYLLNKKNNCIDKLNLDLIHLDTINLDENFNFLCFSNKYNCFFALEIDDNIKILKLDKKFNIDSSQIIKCDFTPTSFKFCQKSNCFFLGHKNNLLKLNSITFKTIENIKLKDTNYNFNTTHEKYFICSRNDFETPKISILNSSKLIAENNFKYNTKIIDIISKKNSIIILAEKGEFSFLFKASLNLKHLDNLTNEYSKYGHEENYNFKKINDINDLYKEEFTNLTTDNEYEEKILNDNYIDKKSNQSDCSKDNNPNYKHCYNYDCDNCSKCHKHNCNKCTCDIENSICEILHSIALVEVSIAHILNAEGEKIQKVLECTCDIEKILKTNKCVIDTIVKVTKLEETLCCKLESLSKKTF